MISFTGPFILYTQQVLDHLIFNCAFFEDFVPSFTALQSLIQ